MRGESTPPRFVRIRLSSNPGSGPAEDPRCRSVRAGRPRSGCPRGGVHVGRALPAQRHVQRQRWGARGRSRPHPRGGCRHGDLECPATGAAPPPAHNPLQSTLFPVRPQTGEGRTHRRLRALGALREGGGAQREPEPVRILAPGTLPTHKPRPPALFQLAWGHR